MENKEPDQQPRPMQALYPTATKGVAGKDNDKPQEYLNQKGEYPDAIEGKKLRAPLPKGVYGVLALSLVLTGMSLYNGSSFDALFATGAGLNVLLAVGLLLRSNLARAVLVVISGIMVGLSLLGMVSLAIASRQYHINSAIVHDLVVNVRNEHFTDSQIERLREKDAVLKSLDKKIGRAEKLAFLEFATGLIGYTVVVAYLTRKPIKDAFI
jgi:hypothetical protein